MKFHKFKNIAIFLLIFILGFSSRACYYFWVYNGPSHQYPGEMMRGALNIATDGRLANLYSSDSGPSAHLAPLYPYAMAGLYRVVGPDLTTWLVALDMTAILLVSLFAASLPWLARRAKLHPLAGYVAGFLVAAIPMRYSVEFQGTWESASLPMALASLLAAFCALGDHAWSSWRSAAMAGLLLGVVALLTPIALAVAAIALAGLFVSGSAPRPRVASQGMVLLLAAGLVIAPWVARNYRVFGAFVPIRSNFGLELMVGNNESRVDPYTPADSPFHPMTNQGELAEYRRVGEIAYMRSKSQAAFAWIASHPARFARLTALRVSRFWFPRIETWPMDRLFPRWSKVALEYGMTLAAFAALGWLFWEKHPHRWPILAVVVGPSLVYSVTHVDIRYQYPSRCFVTLLACDFAVRLLSRRPPAVS